MHSLVCLGFLQGMARSENVEEAALSYHQEIHYLSTAQSLCFGLHFRGSFLEKEYKRLNYPQTGPVYMFECSIASTGSYEYIAFLAGILTDSTHWMQR